VVLVGFPHRRDTARGSLSPKIRIRWLKLYNYGERVNGPWHTADGLLPDDLENGLSHVYVAVRWRYREKEAGLLWPSQRQRAS
jgi:hypothetical protein